MAIVVKAAGVEQGDPFQVRTRGWFTLAVAAVGAGEEVALQVETVSGWIDADDAGAGKAVTWTSTGAKVAYLTPAFPYRVVSRDSSGAHPSTVEIGSLD